MATWKEHHPSLREAVIDLLLTERSHHHDQSWPPHRSARGNEEHHLNMAAALTSAIELLEREEAP